jgi:hypothetical protein
MRNAFYLARILRIVVLIVISISAAYCSVRPGEARAQPEEGLWVCSVYNPETAECTEYVPVAEGVMSGDAIGFTPETVSISIGWGFGIVLVVFIIGISFGVMFRMIASALDPGPL